MKIKVVELINNEISLAIENSGKWIPLTSALEVYNKTGSDLAELKSAASDMVTFLHARKYREMAEVLLNSKAVTDNDFEKSIVKKSLLPFKPLSYRDFMLYEEHYVNAVKGMLKRYLPGKYRFVSFYKKIFKKYPRAVYPKQLWYNKPIYYMGNHLSFVPDGSAVVFPSYADLLDYELELGVLVTRPLFNAAPEEAREAIGGICIFNDFSARNVQIAEMDSGFGPVKTKNFANALSSVIVTADEIMPYINNLAAKIYINDTLKSSGTTANMKFSLEEALAYASEGEHIHPGEFIASGTIPGCSGIETGHLLEPGDELKLEVEKIGTLRNTIKKA